MITNERIVQILFADVDHVDFSQDTDLIVDKLTDDICEAVNTARWMLEIACPHLKAEIAEFEAMFQVLNHLYEPALMEMIVNNINLKRLDRLI